MVRARARKRIDATGRNPTAFGRDNAVLIIRRSLWQSPLVSALSPNARSLMVELLSMFTGSNNGRLFLSLQDATDRLGFSDWRAAATAFEELQTVGLITMTIDAYFDVKAGVHSRARAWRLNWIGDDGERLAPEALPAMREPALSSRARKRLARRQRAVKRYFKDHGAGKFTVVESTTLEARMPENAPAPTVVSTASKGANGRKQANFQMGESTAHLSYHRGTGSLSAWWGTDAPLQLQMRTRLATLAWLAAAQMRRAA
jgi:hypothetical protein